MYHLNARKTVHFPVPTTPRARELMAAFGITDERIADNRRDYRLRLTLIPGDIVCIIGPSGAGKSTLLNALFEQCNPNDRIRLSDIPLPDEATLYDCLDTPLFESLEKFCKAGLSDAFCLLQHPAQLSTGQQFRFRLACVLAGKHPFIFIDEFACNLDSIMAGVISFRIRKETQCRGNKVLILAASREDILPDLQPDVLIRVFSNGTTKTFYRDRSRQREHDLVRPPKSASPSPALR